MFAFGFGRMLGAVNLTEFEFGRFLQSIDNVGIIGGIFSGKLDFQRKIADGTQDRLGYAERVDALLHHLQRLANHGRVGNISLIRSPLRARFGTRGVDLQRKRYPTLQIETELETTLRALQKLLEHQDITLRLIGLADEFGFREEERTEIDTFLTTTSFADIAQSLVIRNGFLFSWDGGILVGLHALLGFGMDFYEVGLTGDDLRRGKTVEGGGSEGVKLDPGHSQGDE